MRKDWPGKDFARLAREGPGCLGPLWNRRHGQPRGRHRRARWRSSRHLAARGGLFCGRNTFPWCGEGRAPNEAVRGIALGRPDIGGLLRCARRPRMRRDSRWREQKWSHQHAAWERLGLCAPCFEGRLRAGRLGALLGACPGRDPRAARRQSELRACGGQSRERGGSGKWGC